MTEFEQRRRAVADSLAEHKVDALLVSSPANVRYLTGYTGSNGLALITPLESHFITDPRYAIEVQSTITAKVHISKVPLIKTAIGIIKRKKIKHLGFEPVWTDYEQYKKIEDALGLGDSLQPVSGVVENLRMAKSPAEVAKIRRAVEANSEAFWRVLRRIRPRSTEQEVAAELDFQMRRLGAEKTSFETIVACGPRSASPHVRPTDHRIGLNELVLIDMGATLDGYNSDMTRMAYMGAPPRRIQSMYRAVAEAQLAALDAVRPGVAVSKVDRAARDVLQQHKLEKEFVHSTGHGLGLEIHEAPKIGKKEKTKLRAGMVITIEPGAYVQDLGGIRIEDTVLVTETGCEVLTPTPKEFFNL